MKYKRDIKNWEPLCITKPKGKYVGHSATGHLLPCCWCENQKDEEFKPLYKENLKIKNVDGIDEILLSDEWKYFAGLLSNDPVKNAPKTCWKYCGKGKGFEIRSQEVYK